MSSDQRPDQSSLSSDEKTARRTRRLLLGFTGSILVSWLTLMAPLPWSLVAGASGLCALVLLVPLVLALVRTSRYGLAVISVVFGTMVSLSAIVLTVFSIVFFGPRYELEQCMRTAITQQARTACEQNATTSIEDWVGGMLGG